jgi:hypothetical protein
MASVDAEGRAGMQRRARNSSRYDRKLGRIAWHLELLFEAAGYVYTQKRVDCNTTLGEVSHTSE